MAEINLIVSGHGGFASGMQAALHLLSAIPDNWSFIDFKESMSDKDLQKEFEKVINNKPDGQFVMFTDLAGGTPFKVAAALSYSNKNIQTVSGCNLGSLLESIYSTYDSSDDMAEKLVSISKEGIQHFTMDDSDSTSTNASDEESDGI
ncbi:PTS sugar transporter [Companilactobacillus nantensis]|uniref:Phosphotransferase system, mannose fructose-specific component IIA n=1 Tax=Companilactobacillus nantensis DSM 16982 TaxID=1423774 RepID=A0A0R1WI04_9LACO|nr:PTS sugar transporter [Companilactobacillus nantensis]KRM17534.1 Phosphotransferase system, mannose fructose-specific component IIA [Companilactobacillus nantensis DSM 16982]GEO64860.1 PTS sugar transporter subunit IIA [Companilactobacillus nantensis]